MDTHTYTNKRMPAETDLFWSKTIGRLYRKVIKNLVEEYAHGPHNIKEQATLQLHKLLKKIWLFKFSSDYGF